MTPLSNDWFVIMVLGHLATDGLDDIFRPPLLNNGIEFAAIADSNRFVLELRKVAKKFVDSPSDTGFSPILRLNVPKTRHTYRLASLIDIADLVRYTVAVAKIASTIEAKRIPASQKVVFSSRFKPGIPFLDRAYNFDGFRTRSHDLSTNGQFSVKVLADISNFYDRLNLHRLQSVLEDIGCESQFVTALNQILLHWAARNSYGLPVGCDASRLLAEAMLINVDDELAQRGVTFLRYVDDYRIFANSYAEAHSHLNVLINALEREALFINAEKTRILACEEHDEKIAQDAAAPHPDFEAIDESEKVPVHIKLMGRYRLKISTYYREPGKDAIKKLQEFDPPTLLDEVMHHDIEEDKLRLFVKVFIYNQNHDVSLLKAFLQRHIHMLGYTVSALIKEANRFTPECRSEICKCFEGFYEELVETNYYRLSIARLLASEPYFVRGIFGKWFKQLKVDANPLFVRELILFFRGRLKREEVRKLVVYSHNTHVAVRRAIVTVAFESTALKEERAAWAKVWVNANTDAYIQSLCRDFLHGPAQPTLKAPV